MVGRKPSPLMPKRKKKPATKPEKETKIKKEPEQTDEEIVDASTPSPSTKRKKAKKPRLRHGVKPSAPQEQLSTEDKRVLRRRRQRRRLIVRIAIATVACALAVVIALNWNTLAPEKVWAWFQDVVSGGTGSFPVDLSGTGVQRVEQITDYTIVLTDSHLLYLNASGAEITRYECAYADPLMRAEGKYVLVAEQNGTRLQLSTRNKLVNEWKTEEKTYAIRAVSLNASGQTAVLTDGPQGYLMRVCVYDETGKLLYSRNSNRNAIDLALSPDGNTVSVTSVEADNGSLNTYVEVFSLKSGGDPQSTYIETDTLLYRIAHLSGGKLAAVHDHGVVLMDTKSGEAVSYIPTGMRMLGYAISGDTVALAMRPYGDTAGGQVAVISATGTVAQTMPFTGEFRHLAGYNGTYTLLTDSYVHVLSADGVKGKATAPADGLQAVWAAGKAVVMGRNQLDAYSVE